jgi:hypothetical protein
MMQSRRDFLVKCGATGLGASLPASMQSFAQEADEEHFFLFIELKGGVHWIVATDGRDPDSLPKNEQGEFSANVMPFAIQLQPPTVEEYQKLMTGDFAQGANLLFPYIGTIQDSYRRGLTNQGAKYCLGFSGFSLEPFINEIAVVRGAYMKGTFHNTAPEMFTGAENGGYGHWSALLSSALAARHGDLVLDNIVVENPYYTPAAANLGAPPIKFSTEALESLITASQIDGFSNWEAPGRFKLMASLSAAISPQWQQSAQRREINRILVNQFDKAADLQNRLKALVVPKGDSSLDLRKQFDAVFPLLQAGVTRVATMCLGAPNGQNQVDGFGQFDCHQGLYHTNESGTGSVNSHRHHLNVERMTGDLAYILQTLKATPFGQGSKSYFDVTTVVVSSEYARPSNLSGNEASGSKGETHFGNGHCYQNNNYILFGKGIQGGAWVGQNDPVTQHAYSMDWRYVDPRDKDVFAAGETAPSEAASVEKFSSFATPVMGPELKLTGNTRPIMARDIGRSLFACADLSNQYDAIYAREDFADARLIQALLRKS